MSQRVAELKQRYLSAYLPVGQAGPSADIKWMVREIERLRAHLAIIEDVSQSPYAKKRARLALDGAPAHVAVKV